jgi:aryl-alcohol dehydrogenase-like predicted oxidoreductase
MMTPTQDPRISSLVSYALLGRSGLRVSPLCLGTMTFRNPGWGSDDATARKIYNRYLEAGGNFLDTADLYSGGESEKILGEWIKADGSRDRLVLATKFNFCCRPGDPNAGGNSRKHIMESVEASLRRLQTDYIDLYWMHAWDTVTPLEEVMAALATIVEQGKVRYIGFSDTPAWYVGAAQTLAQLRGWAPLCALQLEYSLVCRDIEYEFVAAAQNLGLGITPWSPLGGGVLTGKYTREKMAEGGRFEKLKEAKNPVWDKLTERNYRIVDVVCEIAGELDKHPAQVALNWVATRPGVTSTIFGANSMTQLESNLAALEFDLPAGARERLDAVSAPPPMTPYMFFSGHIRDAMTHGGAAVRREPKWFR